MHKQIAKQLGQISYLLTQIAYKSLTDKNVFQRSSILKTLKIQKDRLSKVIREG